MTKPKPRTPAALAIGAPLLAAAAAATAGVVALNRTGFPSRVGASKFEARTPMPGDDLLDEVVRQVDGARLISAAPELVWAWLVTLGSAKGGLNSGATRQRLAASDESAPELEAGETFWVQPGQPLQVVQVVAGRKLVLRTDPAGGQPPSTWGITLRHVPRPGRKVYTRLRVRERHGAGGRNPGAAVVTAVGTWRLLSRLEALARSRD